MMYLFCFFFFFKQKTAYEIGLGIPAEPLFRSHFRIFLMSRKIILIKQELLLLVYELNRSGLLAENEKIRPILAQLEKLLLCDLSPRSEERFSRNAETDLVCRLLLEKKKRRKPV